MVLDPLSILVTTRCLTSCIHISLSIKGDDNSARLWDCMGAFQVVLGTCLQMQETWVRSLGWEDPLEEGVATHSSTLAWRIPRTRILVG